MEAAQPDLSVLRIEKRETRSLSVISIIFIKIEVWQPAQWPEQGGSNKNEFGAKKEEDQKRVRWCTGHEKMPRSLLHSWLQVRRAAIPSDSDQQKQLHRRDRDEPIFGDLGRARVSRPESPDRTARLASEDSSLWKKSTYAEDPPSASLAEDTWVSLN